MTLTAGVTRCFLDLPVMLMTADDDDSLEGSARDAGAREFLRKPSTFRISDEIHRMSMSRKGWSLKRARRNGDEKSGYQQNPFISVPSREARWKKSSTPYLYCDRKILTALSEGGL